MMQIDLFGNVIVEQEEVKLEKPKTASPFDFIKNIADKKYPDTIDGYNPWIINLSFSQRQDTAIFANEMNKYYNLTNREQFDFFYYAMPKKNLFAKWSKAVKSEYREAIAEYFNVSQKVAAQYEKILKQDQLDKIMHWHEKKNGGK